MLAWWWGLHLSLLLLSILQLLCLPQLPPSETRICSLLSALPLLALMSDAVTPSAGKQGSYFHACACSSPCSSTEASHNEALTNTLRPLTDCFLTIRVIKSFEYRTTKNMLLPHVDATTMTVGQLKDEVRTREFLRT